MAEDGGPLARWARKNMPRREDLARSRWMKPFGQRVLHSEFWRFTRRSVPRGVAVGLIVGIFIMIPGLQIIGSALLCIPFRGNIPVAALMTFLSNPFTTPFILTASYFVGSSLGLGGHNSVPGREATIAEWVAWLFSDAALATVSGLFIIAVLSALIGYLASILLWRVWTARKWRRRPSNGGT
ncbi:MAG TPA: DUF2062 domain-containing protein [Allosphingosinicella sp.]|nr:DUF2062 domain-containing protein [Allosphingosinicella sp.]